MCFNYRGEVSTIPFQRNIAPSNPEVGLKPCGSHRNCVPNMAAATGYRIQDTSTPVKWETYIS